MKTNATIQELNEALTIINNKYNGNIRFKTLAGVSSKRNTFTLTVNNSKELGGRIGFTGRRVAAACWRVHGDFFDTLFKINPNVYILSQGKRIDINGGNWEDRNIGSYYQPLYYSEACECN